jgi:hypothetical protein
MSFATNLTQRSRMLYRVALLVGLAFVLFKASLQFPVVFAKFLSGDNDDIMRLMQVRAWLDGQSWFDMTQYRVLPPDGISLHWSRYVDLGISTILFPLSKILPAAQAEQLTLVIWPTLLMILLIGVVARGTNRILGPLAACGAVGSLITWLPTANGYFEPGKLDHHNVQILATTVMAFAMIWPGKPALSGMIAGIAAAFSLAVGLETLPLICAAGVILLVRATFVPGDAERRLVVFCLALTGALVVLFVGQTAPDAWGTSVCDKLSPSLLALAVIASAASLGPIMAGRWCVRPVVRLAASAAIVVVGLWICAPLLSPCLGGPYGALPDHLQDVISRDITEAQPGLLFARNFPLSFHSYATPAVAAVIISIVFWLRRRTDADTPVAESSAVFQMILLACVGVIGTLFQLRMIVLAVPAIAFLTGYAIRCLEQNRMERRTIQSSFAIVLCLSLTLFASMLNGPVSFAVMALNRDQMAALQGPQTQDSCRTADALAELNDLPRATILTTMNVSTSVILTTHHDVITAPYHRSAAAFWNGTYPLQNLDNLKTALQTSAATYVVLCRMARFGAQRAAARALVAGEIPVWLRAVPFEGTHFQVFAVVPDALGS